MLSRLFAALLFVSFGYSSATAQSLEERLLAEPAASLAKAAAAMGDAKRGAVVFYQPYMACRKCHADEAVGKGIGPSLLAMDPKPTDEELVDAVLRPSKTIKKGFESLSVLKEDGQLVQGTLVERDDQIIVLRDAALGLEKTVSISIDSVDQERVSDVSSMPAGQVNVLTSRQQFLDLICYLMEIRDGGKERAAELEPPPSLYSVAAIPEYENNIDHAGMIRGLDRESFKRGEAIYARVCANCHGTHDRPGSLPTSLNFSTGKFKNGNDPFSMYQTLTRGFGLMVPQSWMVPQQKYDAIHYIREAYLKPRNKTQYAEVDDTYLASLPKGDSLGPAPSKIEPWRQMDYGPNLVSTYEIGDDGSNFAYKGNAFRIDPGPGGITQGHSWMVFDYDTLRMSAAWADGDFIDYRGIGFDGSHNSHPRAAGAIHFANPTGPGWARPGTDSFDDPRLIGRDGRRYGPLPRDWAQYRGMYYHGNETVMSYTVGETDVLESESRLDENSRVFARKFTIGPRKQSMLLQVAHDQGLADLPFEPVGRPTDADASLQQLVHWGASSTTGEGSKPESLEDQPLRFDGATFLQVDDAKSIDMDSRDYTILARIKSKDDGTIFCMTEDDAEWVPNGKTFFIRGGRLTFDIGWVGAVESKRKVADGKWHDVAVVHRARDHQLSFFIDGKPAGGGKLAPKPERGEQVARIGFTAGNFPRKSPFVGAIARMEFVQAAMSAQAIADAKTVADDNPSAKASHAKTKAVWMLDGAVGEIVGNSARDGKAEMLEARVIRGEGGEAGSEQETGSVLAGLAGTNAFDLSGMQWVRQGADLRLRIPAGEARLCFTVWMTRVPSESPAGESLAALSVAAPSMDLQTLTGGGAARWPEPVVTQAQVGADDGPFAVDTLTYPLVNPWQCRMRLTGHDFFSDPDRMAVCDWDGNIWLVSGLAELNHVTDSNSSAGVPLSWKRIASGLFQPLGLRVIDDVIHVTCRDQLVRLHDLNGDEAIDWFECINNDHQVTDHFHEFAMGLQTDDEGNFYYAKSARHALPALVPHHGTLLKISKDGETTEIIANGFRAANGVCLNPDGTFIVTDQEGHWNPKNRINWVRSGGFYGNMYGYHDVTDESDDAMDQPLCWITNAFDRSPAELLWVESDRWGPLQGRLLNISYGYGKVFVVPHESIDGQMQGGMIELPIPQFPTGTIRGRFSPYDGQLYLTGMFAWAGSRNEPGGFYRLRYTGKPVCLPVELHATTDGVELQFTEDLDQASVEQTDRYQIKVWDLKRTKNYGSKHYNERDLNVTRATSDGQTVRLTIPELEPTWGMEIRYQLKTESGRSVSGTIHNTIHHQAPAEE